MYAYIKGTLEETGEDYIVVEAGGIGVSDLYDRSDLSVSSVHGEEGKV